MTTGLGSIADLFSASSDLALSTVFSPMVPGETNITGAQDFADTLLNDVSFWTGTFGSTLLGNNTAPVLNPNLAFAQVTNVVPSQPTVGADGNLVMAPANTTPALVLGGQNAADFQANSPSIFGTYNASYNGAGTPNPTNTWLLWTLLAAGGLILVEAFKK